MRIQQQQQQRATFAALEVPVRSEPAAASATSPEAPRGTSRADDVAESSRPLSARDHARAADARRCFTQDASARFLESRAGRALQASGGAGAGGSSGSETPAQAPQEPRFRDQVNGMTIEVYGNDQGLQIQRNRYPDGREQDIMSTDEGLTIEAFRRPDAADSVCITEDREGRRVSQTPTECVLLEGEQPAGLAFDANGNPVLSLPDGQEVVLDGETGDQVLSGPMEIDPPSSEARRSAPRARLTVEAEDSAVAFGRHPRGYTD